MRWRRNDLDFPVLMLRTSPWPPTIAVVGMGPEGTLSMVAVSYGDNDEELRLETQVRRGRRMEPHGPQWVTDQTADIAARAVTGLHLARIRPGDQPTSSMRQQADDAVRQGQQLATHFPGPPWLARPVPVDDVEFAMWSVTFTQGFAAVLDYGPVVLAASGTDLDSWHWHLTAAPPDTTWPLISNTLKAD